MATKAELSHFMNSMKLNAKPLTPKQKSELISALSFNKAGHSELLNDILDNRKTYFLSVPKSVSGETRMIYSTLNISFKKAIANSYAQDGKLDPQALKTNIENWRINYFEHYNAIRNENYLKQGGGQNFGLLPKLHNPDLGNTKQSVARLDLTSFALRYNDELHKHNAHMDTPVIIPPSKPEERSKQLDVVIERLKHSANVETRFIPVHVGDKHWGVLIERKDSIEFYDPLGNFDSATADAIQARMERAFPDKKFIHNKDQIDQTDQWSCGLQVARKIVKEAGIECPLAEVENGNSSGMLHAFIEVLNSPIPAFKPAITLTSAAALTADFRTIFDNEPFKDRTDILKEKDEQQGDYHRIQLEDKKSAGDVMVYKDKMTCQQPTAKSINEMAAIMAAAKNKAVLIQGEPEEVAKLAQKCLEKGLVPHVKNEDGKVVKYQTPVQPNQVQAPQQKPSPGVIKPPHQLTNMGKVSSGPAPQPKPEAKPDIQQQHTTTAGTGVKH